MPARDETKWKDNGDGTWTRTVGGNQETTAVNPNATEGAKQAADAAGVDLAAVEGSGADGRITKADVDKAASA